MEKNMKFKKIYIEITNICNLNCSFCSKDNKEQRSLSVSEFETIIRRINKYTDYIYLHVKGEPLTHPDLDKILAITKKYEKKVCITTNGVLLKEKINILKKYDNIYQINISLHSENKKKNYLEDVFDAVDSLNCYISYRFWTLDKDKIDDKIKKYLLTIKEKYQVKDFYNGIKLKDKTYLSIEDKFSWPDINSNYNRDGYCLGGKAHIAILADGTVSICCLDSKGISNLGNIFKDPLEIILFSPKYQKTIRNFQNNKSFLEICKHCTYKERFSKEKNRKELSVNKE